MAKKQHKFVVYNHDDGSFVSSHDTLQEAKEMCDHRCTIWEVVGVTNCYNKVSFEKAVVEDYV